MLWAGVPPSTQDRSLTQRNVLNACRQQTCREKHLNSVRVHYVCCKNTFFRKMAVSVPSST